MKLIERFDMEQMTIEQGNREVMTQLHELGLISAEYLRETLDYLDTEGEFDLCLELDRLDLPYELGDGALVVWESMEDWEADNDYDY